MEHATLKIKKIHPDAILPTRAHPNDAGLDLYSTHDALIAPQKQALIKTGIAIALEPHTVGLIMDRSSLGKKGLKIAGGVIDAGYRGEILVILWNLSTEHLSLQKGDKIAQLLVQPIFLPKPLEEAVLDDETDRHQKGFGSSGR